jgi:hypothetical protein
LQQNLPTAEISALSEVDEGKKRNNGRRKKRRVMTPTSQYSCCSTHFSQSDLHRRNNPRWRKFTPRQFTLEAKMKTVIGCATIFLTLATITSADAKGCIKGALVGGTAGHFAGHHGVLGAAAGCVIGRHEANKRAKLQRHQTDQRGERL